MAMAMAMARSNTTTNNDNKLLHIAMLPWFATGHMTPFLHLSNELAKRGHKITFFLPHKAKLQLQHLNRYPHLITFHTLTIPHVHGLPPGTQTASEIPISITNLLAMAKDRTRAQVELALSSTKPHLVFHDSVYWLPQVAKKLGIKTVSYNVVCAAALAISFVPARNVPKDRAITEEELSILPQGYPSSKVVLRGNEVRELFFISTPFGEGNMTLYDRITTSFKESDVIAIRTSRELEGSFCDYISAQYDGKRVLLTGPVLPTDEEVVEVKSEEEGYAEWLDGFESVGSVVFCAFGSQLMLEKEQFQEMLLGFELSGFPFLVSLKAPIGCETVEEALPQGFEERVKGRGVVASKGWVQQPVILKHPSVGCFVNHCGFGSMWESLMSDKQIVLVPHLGDQILNTRLLVEELGVAVEVEKGENGWVSKESLSEAIKTVMDEGSEVGAAVKRNHTLFKERVGSAGLMNGYVDKFVQDIQELLIE